MSVYYNSNRLGLFSSTWIIPNDLENTRKYQGLKAPVITLDRLMRVQDVSFFSQLLDVSSLSYVIQNLSAICYLALRRSLINRKREETRKREGGGKKSHFEYRESKRRICSRGRILRKGAVKHLLLTDGGPQHGAAQGGGEAWTGGSTVRGRVLRFFPSRDRTGDLPVAAGRTAGF